MATKKGYAYAWLDNLITHEINPDVMDRTVTPQYLDELKEKIAEKKSGALRALKKQVYSLMDVQETHQLVGKYHDALVGMMGKLHAYQYYGRQTEPHVLAFYDYLASSLQLFLESYRKEFAPYMTADVRVPLNRLLPVRDELLQKMGLLKEILSNGTHGKEPWYIVREALQEFIDRVNSDIAITEHELKYLLELVEHIEEIGQDQRRMTSCPALHELLVYWNLNSKTCIAYFVHGLEGEIRMRKSYEEKLEFLRFQYKNLQQLPQKPNFSYNPEYPNIRGYFLDWLQNELDYLEVKSGDFAPLPAGDVSTMEAKPFKVLVNLTADQIGILLRAADMVKILVARSLSAVFRAIIPYISTPSTPDPSWKNTRGRVNEVRDQDKEAVLLVLDRMAQRIREM